MVAFALPAVGVAAQDRGHLILGVRARNETVDQRDFARTADSLTVRARLGYEPPALHGFKALIEGEGVGALVDDYNSTTKGRARYPQIPDPELIELNRGEISWSSRYADAVVGRRRLAPIHLQFAAHDFSPTWGGGRYGREIDASASIPISPHLSTEIALAHFDGDQPGLAARTKLWVTLKVKY
jgi:hypothetical protein